MPKYLLLLTFLFSISCTNNTSAVSVKEESTINKKNQEKKKEEIITPYKISSLSELKPNQCAKVQYSDTGFFNLKYASEGVHSFAFFRYYEKKDKENYFTSLPKKELKGSTLTRINCPEVSVTLSDLHDRFIKNPVKYTGSNTDIKNVQVGQCVHHFQGIMVITAILDDKISTAEDLGSRDPWKRVFKRAEFNEDAVITDCLDDMYKKYRASL